MRRLLLAATVITVITFITFIPQVFAQDASAPFDGTTAPFDGATSPAGRRDQLREQLDQRVEQRRQQLEERKAEIQTRRTEKQKQIIARMKQKLASVINRLNNVAGRLKNHVAKIRARAEELKANRGADISAVQSALTEAEKHIGLAETEIANVKSKLSELDATDQPRGVVQTFRTGVQSVHSHFKDARTNLVAALKALREAAKESRPTEAAE